LFSISTRGDHLFTMARMRERPETAMLADVLIADDNRDTREMYALYLSMLGYHVAIAADGGEAVRVARGHRPDLIVMDLDMPDMDGWAAIRELQSDACTASIPVIVLTGHDFKTQLKDQAIAVGAVCYLMKPCFPEQLEREINARLAVQRARMTAAL
jgi:CheY-like chemotaxis protein